jgi:pimeloyl-ACP methyl ester carboxylesterase
MSYRRRRRRRLSRALLHVLSVIALVVLSGITLQAVVEGAERERFPAPGLLIETGDGQVSHVRVWGADSDGPTIVAEASAGMTSSEWAWVGQALSDEFRVVAVDRPGLGWSRGGGVRDAESAVRALEGVLVELGIEPPYVVVGHSFGGLAARVFADRQRDDVIGLALLDSTHPDGGGRDGFVATYRAAALIAHTGLLQLRPRAATGLEGLPPAEADAAVAVSGWTSHLDATAEEIEAWDASTAQARSAGRFDDFPLLIVRSPLSADHLELQRDLLNLSERSRFVQLQGVSHIGMLTNQPESEILLAELRPWLDEVAQTAN